MCLLERWARGVKLQPLASRRSNKTLDLLYRSYLSSRPITVLHLVKVDPREFRNPQCIRISLAFFHLLPFRLSPADEEEKREAHFDAL